MSKIYCKNCKWFKYEIEFIGKTYRTTIRDTGNFFLEKDPDVYGFHCERKSDIEGSLFKKCKYYKRKWYKFWVK